MKSSDWIKLIRLASQRFKFIWRKPSATVEYPFVSRQTAPHVRAGLRNDFSQCTGCLKCEKRCPVTCIHIQSEDFPPDIPRPQTSQGVAFEQKVTSYVIDFNKCLFCGLCVEICPTGSLTFDKSPVGPRREGRHLAIDLVHRPRTLRTEQGFE